jgi:hypothetical protein
MVHIEVNHPNFVQTNVKSAKLEAHVLKSYTCPASMYCIRGWLVSQSTTKGPVGKQSMGSGEESKGRI